MFKYLLRLWLAVLCSFSVTSVNAAVQSEEVALKAAFIYNFSLFTTWPQAKTNLNFCVLGEGGYVEALAKYEGRKAGGASIHVQKIDSAEDAHVCEVLFIGVSENAHMQKIYEVLHGLPVLTIAEYGILDPPGVMITLKRDSNKVAFEINQNYAKDAGLNLSYKLLKLAKKVK